MSLQPKDLAEAKMMLSYLDRFVFLAIRIWCITAARCAYCKAIDEWADCGCSGNIFCNDNTLSSQTTSSGGPCPPGHYCVVGSSRAQPCPAGSYSPFWGMAQCFKCPEGFYCKAGSTNYTACPTGESRGSPIPPWGTWGNRVIRTLAVLCEAVCLVDRVLGWGSRQLVLCYHLWQ